MSTETGGELEAVWKALSDPTRRFILDLLRSGPANTMAIVEEIPELTHNAVINHIKTLEAAGLIRVERRGRERINHLNAAPLHAIYDRWLTPFEQIWASRLHGLTTLASKSRPASDQETPMQTNPATTLELIQQLHCDAEPETIWHTLTQETAAWWTAPYLDADSLGIELTLAPGGTLWDKRGPESGYAIALVRGYTPNRELILDGDFGVPGAITGRLVVTIDRETDATSTVTFANTSIGDIDPRAAANHDTGWRDLLTRLCEAAGRNAASSATIASIGDDQR